MSISRSAEPTSSLRPLVVLALLVVPVGESLVFESEPGPEVELVPPLLLVPLLSLPSPVGTLPEPSVLVTGKAVTEVAPPTETPLRLSSPD
ncbi:hypothetical protein POL58_09685 [Nannocystis sp. ncelm1]|uniref:Secreted protein n=1 Tax=Nannocystis radixulma TaxID=2995305 RepID=A0ABT5B1M9_9BACT|nr:hypothetical protein [Nannocystis radixulma]